MQEETTIILLGAGDDAAGTIAALVADGEFFGLIVVDCRQNDFQEISPQLNKIALAAIPELEFDYSIKPPTKNRKFSFEPANYSPPDIVNFNGLSFDARARAKI